MKFKKPTLKEAFEYAKENNLKLDVEYWYWKNEERGWVVVIGKTIAPMKNWKANMRTWERLTNKPPKKWDKTNNLSGDKSLKDRFKENNGKPNKSF